MQPLTHVSEYVCVTARWLLMRFAVMEQEYKHFKAEQEAKLKGETAH